MAQILERVPYSKVWVDEDPSLWCEPCGYGATVGSPAALANGYEEGKPCGHCGTPMVVEDRGYWSRTPAHVVLRCNCGEVLHTWDSFLNTCGSCGRDYNGSGQALAPRHHWGEETGEHWTDVVMAGNDPDGLDFVEDGLGLLEQPDHYEDLEY